MEITLAPEDQLRITRILAQGGFTSAEEAISAGLTLLEAGVEPIAPAPRVRATSRSSHAPGIALDPLAFGYSEPPAPFAAYEIDVAPYLRR